ncbi:hypothetical protein OSB04_003263 [Centaurea solstitialis]|uniref:DUF4005 domain-containing protein n=1 Tax=Centaurea solstitialis TaxID=347529 RepID=A0AA38UBT8_9ASTR|nr:hypothetical protein OSB04_003263 [Centaurea solstitialis]
MGKSPGRWIKTLIFGKKSPRSKIFKPHDDQKKKGDGKELAVSIEEIGNTNLSSGLSQRSGEKIQEEKPQSHNSQGEIKTPLHPNQAISIAATAELNAQNDLDRNREEQAATAVQAVLRGYLARRAYGTLKGVVRLQALIRGHLVRRQAISTLYCMFRIVKFQAVIRGRKIRHSDIGVEVQKRCTQTQVMCYVGVDSSIQILKLSSNGFARKLSLLLPQILASSPSAMPLHFQYNPNETNSVLRWLERWSTSHFWELLPKPKVGNHSKLPKPNGRRFSMSNVESIASEFDKPIVNSRRLSAYEPENYVDENPELVLERVKRNLRKVHNPVLDNTTVQKETETEKKSINDDTRMIETKLSELETTPKQVGLSEAEKMITTENKKEDCMPKEQKKSKRRVSLPVNQEFMENNEPQPIKPSLPSYMAPTVSAKAKLRGQDGCETTPPLSRRYSLPSLGNAKASVSPRVQRSTQTAGKFKNDRSLQLSRDGHGT